MMALGRSLEVARAVAIVLGALSVAAPYAAMRVAGAAPRRVLLRPPPWPWRCPGTRGSASPRYPRRGPGPSPGPRCWPWPSRARARGRARALLAASLSRYETWPACAVLAALCAAAAMRGHRARNLVLGLLAIAGPLLWMLWNAHAHGSPLHFLARVSAFRRAIGAAEQPLPSKLLAYPLALLTETPEAAALGAVGARRAVRQPHAPAALARRGRLRARHDGVLGRGRCARRGAHPSSGASPVASLVGAHRRGRRRRRRRHHASEGRARSRGDGPARSVRAGVVRQPALRALATRPGRPRWSGAISRLPGGSRCENAGRRPPRSRRARSSTSRSSPPGADRKILGCCRRFTGPQRLNARSSKSARGLWGGA
jgi:hypothetical protein